MSDELATTGTSHPVAAKAPATARDATPSPRYTSASGSASRQLANVSVRSDESASIDARATTSTSVAPEDLGVAMADDGVVVDDGRAREATGAEVVGQHQRLLLERADLVVEHPARCGCARRRCS